MGEKIVFSINHAVDHTKKIQLDLYLMIRAKINDKWIIDLNVKPKESYKTFERNKVIFDNG